MIFKYRKQILLGVFILLLCVLSVYMVVILAFSEKTVATTDKITVVNENGVTIELEVPKTKRVETTTKKRLESIIREGENDLEEAHSMIEDVENEFIEVNDIPYKNNPPEIIDDGSIVWDGLTITELTNKLNKSLESYLTNTGYFFALYAKNEGLNPYLAVAITRYESGCGTSGCSGKTIKCNNLGGLRYSSSKTCSEYGGNFSKFDTIDEGIQAYLNTVLRYQKKYNLDDPQNAEKTIDGMSSKYSNNSKIWPSRVKYQYNKVKNA